jgi:hypothetical protein
MTLQNTIGATKIAMISVAHLMLDIDKAAVEMQSDLTKSSLWKWNRNVMSPWEHSLPDWEDLPTFASSSHNAKVGAAPRLSPTILLALVKGLADGDTKDEILSKVKQMDLDETVDFVEVREIGKRDLLLLGWGPSSGQVNAVQVQGKCCRCGQEGQEGQSAGPCIIRRDWSWQELKERALFLSTRNCFILSDFV